VSYKALLSKPLAAWVIHRQKKWVDDPSLTQQRILKALISQGKNTLFGQHHQFGEIQSYADYKAKVPIREYEGFLPYIDKIKLGDKHVLWPGKPIYWAKTSGTTAGSKYIPITQASIAYHILAARNALLYYIYETGRTSFLEGHMLFLSGSPALELEGGIPAGRLSGIVNHHVPSYLRKNQLPSYTTNCIEDWEEKVDQIIEETLAAKLSLLSGIPPWMQMYLERLQQRTGRPTKDMLPHLSLIVHGGVNFEPYRAKLFDTLGRRVDTIETYPASEGFIAFQDSQNEPGLLLQLNSGMFFEFIPTKTYFSQQPTRLCIDQVELGVEYVLVLTSNAGLWAYALGDTIKFVSLHPPKIVVTGRVKHFISAFGEHVIMEEVEKALQVTLAKHPEVRITEFTVAPWVSKELGQASYHEWLIEFSYRPKDLVAFATDLDQAMCRLNPYYHDLIKGHILEQLRIRPLEADAFTDYMRKIGKLGGQNKVVRLSNNRLLADALEKYKIH
jgi:hypothetical protein